MASCSRSKEGAPIRVQHDFAIGGVQLKFPCKPYPTQMAMMAKVMNIYEFGTGELYDYLINAENCYLATTYPTFSSD